MGPSSRGHGGRQCRQLAGPYCLLCSSARPSISSILRPAPGSISTGLQTGGVQGIRLADMDMDGSTEVVIWSSRSIFIYEADSDFTWSQIASFAIAETALSGMTIGDFDHASADRFALRNITVDRKNTKKNTKITKQIESDWRKPGNVCDLCVLLCVLWSRFRPARYQVTVF